MGWIKLIARIFENPGILLIIIGIGLLVLIIVLIKAYIIDIKYKKQENHTGDLIAKVIAEAQKETEQVDKLKKNNQYEQRVLKEIDSLKKFARTPMTCEQRDQTWDSLRKKTISDEGKKLLTQIMKAQNYNNTLFSKELSQNNKMTIDEIDSKRDHYYRKDKRTITNYESFVEGTNE